MVPNKTMDLSSRKKSFAYAWSGLLQLFKLEPNAKLHALATLVAITAGIARHITTMQWAAIIFAIGLVWITEALNTCIEKLCNLWCGNKWHPEVKIIKDIAAGAVLIAALVSVAIAVIVFFF
jgi:diacylglycerol kinase (ATP)